MTEKRERPQIMPMAEYKLHEGAAVFTYINNSILEYVAQQSITALGKWESVPNDHSMQDITPSALALYAVGKHLNRPFRAVNANLTAVKEHCALDDQTLRGMRNNTSDTCGLADLDFTGHFAPGVAANIVSFFVQEGIITSEQQRVFTLTDYANLINTGWFSTIMHTFARTSNGVFGRFGNDAYHYKQDALRRHLDDHLSRKHMPKTSLFTYAEKTDPDDGYAYHTANITPAVVQLLRKQLRRGVIRTLGCPVARHNVTLDDQLVEESIPAQQLLESQALVPSGKELRDGSDRTHYELPYSTIDNALILLGQRLIAYDNIYGTPYPHTSRFSGKRMWRHKKQVAVDVLRRKVLS